MMRKFIKRKSSLDMNNSKTRLRDTKPNSSRLMPRWKNLRLDGLKKCLKKLKWKKSLIKLEIRSNNT